MKKIVILLLCCSVGTAAINYKPQVSSIYSSLNKVIEEDGSPYLLVFFSTSCQVCWEDLIEMRHFIGKNKVAVRLIGISKEPRLELEIFIEKYSIDCPVVNDREGKLYKKYQVDLEPFKLIVMNEIIIYRDDYYDHYLERRDKVKKLLLEMYFRN